MSQSEGKKRDSSQENKDFEEGDILQNKEADKVIYSVKPIKSLKHLQL